MTDEPHPGSQLATNQKVGQRPQGRRITLKLKCQIRNPEQVKISRLDFLENRQIAFKL